MITANNAEKINKIRYSAFAAATTTRGIRSMDEYFLLTKALIEIAKETHDDIMPVT